MYNGMIAPVIPYAIRGVLWYQGEAINGGATGYKLYPLLQATLIKDSGVNAGARAISRFTSASSPR